MALREFGLHNSWFVISRCTSVQVHWEITNHDLWNPNKCSAMYNCKLFNKCDYICKPFVCWLKACNLFTISCFQTYQTTQTKHSLNNQKTISLFCPNFSWFWIMLLIFESRWEYLIFHFSDNILFAMAALPINLAAVFVQTHPPIVVVYVFLVITLILRAAAAMLWWPAAVPVYHATVFMLIVIVLVSLAVTAPILLTTSRIVVTTTTRGTGEGVVWQQNKERNYFWCNQIQQAKVNMT